MKKLTKQLPIHAEILAEVLKNTNKKKTMKSHIVVANINTHLFQKNMELINDQMLRSIVNYCRQNSICPIISNSDGYFISYDFEDVHNCSDSLRNRALSILKASNGLMKFLQETPNA